MVRAASLRRRIRSKRRLSSKVNQGYTSTPPFSSRIPVATPYRGRERFLVRRTRSPMRGSSSPDRPGGRPRPQGGPASPSFSASSMSAAHLYRPRRSTAASSTLNATRFWSSTTVGEAQLQAAVDRLARVGEQLVGLTQALRVQRRDRPGVAHDTSHGEATPSRNPGSASRL